MKTITAGYTKNPSVTVGFAGAFCQGVTVRSDIEQTAVSMLSDRINGRDTALVSVLNAELVVRDSTGPVC